MNLPKPPRPVNWMRGILALVLVLGFQAALAMLFFYEVPEKNRSLVDFMLGQASGMAMLALGFYFATTKSSAEKTEHMAESNRAAQLRLPPPDPYPLPPYRQLREDEIERPEFGPRPQGEM